MQESCDDLEVDLDQEWAWWVEGDVAWKITKEPQGLTLDAWHEESDQPIEQKVSSREALSEAKAELFDLVTKTNLDLSDLDQFQGLEQWKTHSSAFFYTTKAKGMGLAHKVHLVEVDYPV